MIALFFHHIDLCMYMLSNAMLDYTSLLLSPFLFIPAGIKTPGSGIFWLCVRCHLISRILQPPLARPGFALPLIASGLVSRLILFRKSNLDFFLPAVPVPLCCPTGC